MHFTKTLASMAALTMTAYAGLPVASVELLYWEQCDVGRPAVGEGKFSDDLTADPLTCDSTTVNSDWSIDNYSFRAYLDTKDAIFCHGVIVWNNEDCSGDPLTFVPFNHEPFVEGKCLPDILEPGFVSVKLACDGFPGEV